MKRPWRRTALTVLMLGVGLAVWMLLPWQGAVVLALLLALWLRLSRSGRLAWAAARIGIASLPQRYGTASVIVIGIAGVVAVLVAMLAMAEGFRATMEGTGDDRTAIVLRGGSHTEISSSISREQVPLVATLAGVGRDAQGRALVSAELSQVVSLLSASNASDVNVQLRGLGEQGWAVHARAKIVEGRAYVPGRRELVAGRGAQRQFRGIAVGQPLRLGNQQWMVVGLFASGDANESELWADAQTVADAFNRDYYQAIHLRTAGVSGYAQFKAAMAADPRLKLDVQTSRAFYGKQAGGLNQLLTVLGTVIGTIMALGAVFGALNTMYAAVATRACEIATMRAIGFRALPVVMAVMLEAMLLALLGGLTGGLIAWALFNGYSVSTMGSNFSQVVFQFRVAPTVLWSGLKWALGIGLIGGLFPALRAAYQPIAESLRAR